MMKLMLAKTVTVCGAAALMLGSATPLLAQRSGTRLDRNAGATDSAKLDDPKSAVRVTNAYAQCIARRGGRSMRTALDLPFTSPEQSKALKRTQDQFDGCLGESPEFDTLASSTVMIVGGAAEWFVNSDLKKVDLLPLKGMTDQMLEKTAYRPRTGLEDLGLCIVRRDPARARAVLATRPTSEEESAAFKAMVPDVGLCVPQGSTMTLNKPNLRAVVAYALYRAATNMERKGA